MSATTLIATLAKAESEGQLRDKLNYFAKPKLLVIDELGYLPFEQRSAHLFFQLVTRRYERGSMLITTNQLVAQWGGVFGDDVLAAAILDSPNFIEVTTQMLGGWQSVALNFLHRRHDFREFLIIKRLEKVEDRPATRGCPIVSPSPSSALSFGLRHTRSVETVEATSPPPRWP